MVMKNGFIFKNSWLPLVLILLFESRISSCDAGTVEIITNKLESKCIDCPKNCEHCYLNKLDKPSCIFCKTGFFLDDKNACKKCYKNCSRCGGPELNQCYNLQVGYHVNEDNEIEKCNKECSRCHSKDKCMGCIEGYYISKRSIDISRGLEVECSKCGIKNCKVCDMRPDQIPGSNYLACLFCEPGYAVVSGKCKKCPKNCKYCVNQNLECRYCDHGYYLDKKTSKCKKLTVKNCFNMDDNGKCIFCENHFYLEQNQCKACKSREEHCNFCSFKGGVFNCLNCEQGYYRTNDRKCLPCSEKCNHCNENQCFMCEKGYFYDRETKQCEKCMLDNCKQCLSNSRCISCKAGYAFISEKKACEKCEDNCLECFGKVDNCIKCPVTYYTLQVETISKRTIKTGLAGMLFGAAFSLANLNTIRINMVNKCVKKCPEYYNDKKVKVVEAIRRCVVLIDENSHETALPIINQSGNVFERLNRLKVEYDQEITRSVSKAKSFPSKLKSDSCNYRGVTVKKERGNYDSYFFCRCDEGYVGDNCQLPVSVVHKYQNQIIDILNEIDKSFSNNNNHTRKLFLDSLITINKFKSSLQIIRKNLEIVKDFLRHDKSIDNRKKLYHIYDAFLLNLFDLMDDLKRVKVEEYEIESDIKKKNDMIYDTVSDIVKAIEDSFEDLKYSHSFLQRMNKHYIAQDTYSYIIGEYPFKNYKPKTGFFITNPNIDMSSYVNFASNEMFFEFREDTAVDRTKVNIQVIVFSAALFENKMNNYGQVAISNFLYIRAIDPSYPHIHISMAGSSVEFVKIKFALLFVPIFDNIEENIACIGFNFDNNRKVKGELIRFIDAGDDTKDPNTAFAECQFNTNFKYRSFYFGVTMNKV